jgi:hypothetical protein
MTKYEKDLNDQFELTESGFSTSLYKKLIRNWHEKATTEDYFSKFVFEYLAFAAIIRKYFNIESKSDRDAVNRLKGNKVIEGEYLLKIQKELNENLNKLINYLNGNPVKNGDKEIQIQNEEDWPNMVELIYSVRNNLFHGGKDPDDARDKLLVENAYKLLRPLVEILLNKIDMSER